MTKVEQQIYDTATQTRAEKTPSLFEQYESLIKQKAAKLKKLNDIDLFEWSDKYGADSANYKFREKISLEHEIKVLLAVAQYVNDMSDFYDSDIQELTDKLQANAELIDLLRAYVLNTLDNCL